MWYKTESKVNNKDIFVEAKEHSKVIKPMKIWLDTDGHSDYKHLKKYHKKERIKYD